MPLNEALVFIREIPMASLPGTLGVGPMIPVTLIEEEQTEFSFADFPIPSGHAVTLTLTGAGGGGSGPRTPDPTSGNGGGGGGSVTVLIPAEVWAAGGNLIIGQPGDGGSGENGSGAGGQNSYLQFNSPFAEIFVNGGAGGAGASAVPAAGGTVVFSGSAEGYTVIAARRGYPGSVPVGATGGVGGLSGGGDGGRGGRGANASGEADGFAGGGGVLTISFYP